MVFYVYIWFGMTIVWFFGSVASIVWTHFHATALCFLHDDCLLDRCLNKFTKENVLFCYRVSFSLLHRSPQHPQWPCTSQLLSYILNAPHVSKLSVPQSERNDFFAKINMAMAAAAAPPTPCGRHTLRDSISSNPGYRGLAETIYGFCTDPGYVPKIPADLVYAITTLVREGKNPVQAEDLIRDIFRNYAGALSRHEHVAAQSSVTTACKSFCTLAESDIRVLKLLMQNKDKESDELDPTVEHNGPEIARFREAIDTTFKIQFGDDYTDILTPLMLKRAQVAVLKCFPNAKKRYRNNGTCPVCQLMIVNAGNNLAGKYLTLNHFCI